MLFKTYINENGDRIVNRGIGTKESKLVHSCPLIFFKSSSKPSLCVNITNLDEEDSLGIDMHFANFNNQRLYIISNGNCEEYNKAIQLQIKKSENQDKEFVKISSFYDKGEIVVYLYIEVNEFKFQSMVKKLFFGSELNTYLSFHIRCLAIEGNFFSHTEDTSEIILDLEEGYTSKLFRLNFQISP